LNVQTQNLNMPLELKNSLVFTKCSLASIELYVLFFTKSQSFLQK